MLERKRATEARRGLQAVAPLLEQQPCTTLAGEVCSYKCRVFDIPGGQAEDVADVLMAYGAQSVSIEEFRQEGAPEQEIFVADKSAADRLWDRCTVVAYFAREADAAEVLEAADAAGILEAMKADCGLDHHGQAIEAVRAQDWEEAIRVGAGCCTPGAGVASFAAWHALESYAVNSAVAGLHKDSYQPTAVEEGLWIVPVWSSPVEPAAINILLEPGLAFGTGDHPTTRLCLKWLRRLQLGGASVMDYGTGSGVLAIAGLLMGASRAVGTDVEPLSIKAARANAAHNAVADRLAVYQCSPRADDEEPLDAAGVPQDQRQFDVVVANILQGPLLSLAPRLAAYAKPGAALGLSGILREQAPGVIQAYSPYFEGFEVTGEDNWALVTARRKGRGTLTAGRRAAMRWQHGARHRSAVTEE
ncbi:hypothetical protein N2152v2_003428 [Parachlorella kessleri]